LVTYVPDQGDVVWLEFDPQKGHEIKKKGPALIISPKAYNKKTRLALVMPITSKAKGYPFEVSFESTKVEGVILSDQVRSLDWEARNAKKITSLSRTVIEEALTKFQLLLQRG
jgi:mRNA interferase MazF